MTGRCARHSEHQRHPDGDRDGGERLPHDRVHDRRRLGGRPGGRADHQGRVEFAASSSGLSDDMDVNGGTIADGAGDDRSRSASASCARSSSAGDAASRAARRRSATRNSSLDLQDLRAGRARPACRSEIDERMTENAGHGPRPATESGEDMSNRPRSSSARPCWRSSRWPMPRAPRTTSGSGSTGCITARMRPSRSARTRAISRSGHRSRHPLRQRLGLGAPARRQWRQPVLLRLLRLDDQPRRQGRAARSRSA